MDLEKEASLPDPAMPMNKTLAALGLPITIPPIKYIPWSPVVRGSYAPGNVTLGVDRALISAEGNLKFIYVHVTIASISGFPLGNLEIANCPASPIYETPLTLGVTSNMELDLSQRYIMPIINTNGKISFLSCGRGPEQAIALGALKVGSTLQLAGSFITKA